MAGEGLDEWDADFIDQLVQAEELALSTQLSHQSIHPPPPQLPPPPPPPPRQVSYSPPRELSQRPHEPKCGGGITDTFDALAPPRTHFAKERELDRVQKELNRVSKQLNHLENECSELRKERDKKEEQLKELHSRIETDGFVSSPSAPGQNAGTSTSQNTSCRSEKLFGLWNSKDQKQGRVLVATVLKTCEADFHELNGYLHSHETGSNQQHPTQPIGSAKVSHLYSVLTNISNDAMRLEDFLEALVDICNLKNVFLVNWSLRVLRKILSNPFCMGKEFGKRENVIVEDPLPENTKSGTSGSDRANESLCFANIMEMLKRGQIPSALKLSNVETPGFSGFFYHSFVASLSQAYEFSVFERMCLIATKNNEEQIRREALAVMNLILMRHNAYSERDRFAGELVFRTLSQLLRKEAGFSVQDEAVRALYLLCNCPKVMAMITGCVKEDRELACPKDINDDSAPTFQWLNEILIGLADCVACYGSATAEEMKLRKNAIVFLAFLGSSGKSGFEILLNHRLPKGTHFLAIILQSLISDLDRHTLRSAKKSDVAREQSLLIREALIFLNRLVSHPQYSVPVLQSLTATREMASTTMDFANRLSQKNMLLWKDKDAEKQIREIVEFALVFKRRVSTYLGDNIS